MKNIEKVDETLCNVYTQLAYIIMIFANCCSVVILYGMASKFWLCLCVLCWTTVIIIIIIIIAIIESCCLYLSFWHFNCSCPNFSFLIKVIAVNFLQFSWWFQMPKLYLWHKNVKMILSSICCMYMFKMSAAILFWHLM